MNVSLTHIKNWRRFENLVEDYFKEINNPITKYPSILKVKTFPSGIGADKGKDVVVTFSVGNPIDEFEVTWVIQCKFHKRTIGLRHLSNVNIPTLLHHFKANGYLLICKNDITDELSDFFKTLNRDCKMGYKYLFWRGSDFETRLESLGTNCPVMKKYFSRYCNYVDVKEATSKLLVKQAEE